MPPPPPNPPLSYATHSSIKAEHKAVPVADLAATDLHRLCVGVAVLHHTPVPRVLLVQRAAEEALPNTWEIPGGSAELYEPNLVASAARELYEETGLRARAITALLGMYTWTDVDAEGNVLRRRDGTESKWRKLSFLAEVEGGDGLELPRVLLDPHEHQAFVWATEDEAHADQAGEVKIEWTSAEQKADVIRSFELAKTVLARRLP